MKIIVAGLGRMGSQIAKKLHEGGHKVVALNRSPEPVREMVSLGMLGAFSKEEALAFFAKKERVALWLMISAGAMDEELDKWLNMLPKGSIIIDGGNSDYRLTRKRAEKAKRKGQTLLDVGTSGGIWGYENGFSMMAGGDKSAFKTIEPLLKTLAKPSGGYAYFGEPGSGHYVKMVHNAIEYGMMESLAEGYRLLKEGPYKNLELAKAGDVWQKRSVITSWLNGLMADALRKNKDMRNVDGAVAESGEARWALETAEDLSIRTPAIRASFDVRIESQRGKINFATKLLSLTRNAFGGHKINEATEKTKQAKRKK